MAGYCLPKNLVQKFQDALRSGDLDPKKLRNMSSEERRAEFSKYIGDDHAREINAALEQKLLLQDQQKGMLNWMNDAQGLNQTARRDILNRIQNMKKVLTPKDAKSFFEDLAAKKLGVQVTDEEARTIFQLSEDAKAKRQALFDAGINNSAKTFDDKPGLDLQHADARSIDYGNSTLKLQDYIDSLKPDTRSLNSKIVDAANIPKSMLTSAFHFSAPFVQGWGMMSSARWWEGWKQMGLYFMKEENYNNLQAWIISHPYYYTAKKAGLGLTDLSDILTKREEAMQSTYVQKLNTYIAEAGGLLKGDKALPINIVAASSRAFTGYLNYVRFSRYVDLMNGAKLLDEDISAGSQVSHDLAQVVNNFTGRGNLGINDVYKNVAPALNIGIFSPRKIVATMQMWNPERYITLSPVARQAAVKQLLGSIMITASVMGIARAVGLKVGWNPLEKDFGQISIGDEGHEEVLDMTGGNSRYVQLLSRIAATAATKTYDRVFDKTVDPYSYLGDKHYPTTVGEMALRYIRGKLSPIAAYAVDAALDKDPVGREFSTPREIKEKFVPIAINSYIDFFQNNPNDTAAIVPSLSAIFGVELHSPLPPADREGLTVWGDQVGMFSDPQRTDLDTELMKDGIKVQYPPRTINGVKLNNSQYHDYIKLSGQMAKQSLTNLVSTDGWNSMPSTVKQQVVKSIVRGVQNTAGAAIMNQSVHGDNDILDQSTKNWQKKANELRGNK